MRRFILAIGLLALFSCRPSQEPTHGYTYSRGFYLPSKKEKALGVNLHRYERKRPRRR